MDKRECIGDIKAAANGFDSHNAEVVGQAVENIKADKMVYHPSHYNRGGIEVFDVIEAFGLSYALGNVLKYACRAYYKGKVVQDLEKALFYLSHEIERVKMAIKENRPWKPYNE